MTEKPRDSPSDHEAVQFVEQFLTCPICSNVLVNAVTNINCNHSYCAKCIISNNPTEGVANDSLSCQVCQQGFRTDHLRPNLVLNVMSQRHIGRAIQNLGCIQCARDNSTVTHMCITCPAHLCAECARIHCGIPVCQSHEVVGLASLDQLTSARVEAKANCCIHKDQKLSEFCVNCRELVCHVCVQLSHLAHKRQSVKQALDESLEKFRRLHNMSDSSTPLNKTIVNYTEESIKLRKNQEDVKSEILKHMDIVVDKVKYCYEALCSKVDISIEAQVELLRVASKPDGDSVKALESWVKSLIDNTDGAGLLLELNSGLLHQLELAKQQPKPVELYVFHPATQNWTCSRTELKSVQMRHSHEVHREMKNGRKDNSQVAKRKCKYIHDNYRKTILSLGKDSLKLSRHLKTFELGTDTLPYRMCLFQGQLWIPCHDAGIQIYSTLGSCIKTLLLDAEGIQQPRSLHPYPHERLALAAKNGLYLLDHEGKKLYTFNKGNFNDVTIDNKKMVALEEKEQAVYIWKIQDLFQGETVIKVNFNTRSWATLFLNTDTLYVCDGYLGNIHTYSLAGELLQESTRTATMGIGNNAAVNLLCPYICGMDHKGNLLVSDKNNDRLQCQAKDGSREVIEHFTVESPLDVVISSDSMFVLHGVQTRKLSIFKV